MILSEKPTIITFDLHDCKYSYDIPMRIRDAFWDLLSEPREYTIVEVTGLSSLSKELYEYSKKIVELLEKNKKYYEMFMEIQNKWDRRFDYRIID